jgi:hypothetical protein
VVIPVRFVLAASSVGSPLAGSQFEILPFDAQIDFAVQADATGVLATIQSGTDILSQEAPVQLGTINVQPKVPDDFFLTDVAGYGERISINLRDTSGAQRIVMVVVRITPLT